MKPKILNVDKLPLMLGKYQEKEFILYSIELAYRVKATPKIFVEIGTMRGYTARAVITSLNQLNCTSEFYSIDINLPMWDHINKKNLGWSPIDEWDKTCGPIKSQGTCKGEFIGEKSTKASSRFKNNSLSWCFVDACHCYECAKNDLEHYIPKVVEGGYLLIDDTKEWDSTKSQWYHDVKNPKKFGVNKAVHDCKLLHNQFKLVSELDRFHGKQLWQKI